MGDSGILWPSYKQPHGPQRIVGLLNPTFWEIWGRHLFGKDPRDGSEIDAEPQPQVDSVTVQEKSAVSSMDWRPTRIAYTPPNQPTLRMSGEVPGFPRKAFTMWSMNGTATGTV